MLAEELVEQWPQRWPRPTVGSTKNCHSQVKPFGSDFEGLEVERIPAEVIRRWATRPENRGRARYVRTMLNDAVDAGVIESNPLAGVRIPKPRKIPQKWPTERQVERLIAVADKEFGSFILAAAYTGLRLGELRGLRKSDVELKDGLPHRLHVQGQMNREEKWVLAKTEASENVAAILPQAAPAFMLALQSCTESLLWPYTRDQHQAFWDEVREMAGVKVKWHSLRHYCATFLLDRGATMDDVALQLRCSVNEVRKTYAHPDRDAALGRLEAIAAA